MRISIIGGGIGGLTACVALRKLDFDAQVYERSETLGEVGAGLMVATNAMTVLQRLNIAEPLLDTCPTLENVHIATHKGEELVTVPVGYYAKKYGAPTLCAHRSTLHGALADAVDPSVLHMDHDYASFDVDGDNVTAHFGDTSVESDVLVGADGLRSRVRKQVLDDDPPRYSGYTCWRGIVDDADELWPTGQLNEFAGPGLRFGVVNIGQGRVYWYATANVDQGFDTTPPTRDDVAERFSGFTDPIPSIIEATPESAVMVNDCYDRKPVKRWGEGPVSLLGDAAHPTTPNLGQGACQAIEDGWFIAKALGTGVKIEGALRAYETLRAPRTAWIVNQSRRFGEVGQWSNPFMVWLRPKIIRSTPKSTYNRQYERLFTLAD